jgi:hypothetical protein
MNLSAITTLFVAALATANAATIPREHHARFLAEQATLTEELAAWKDSPAGRYAKENNLYKEASSSHTDTESASVESNDHLTRFFLSKVTAEKAQRENPEATYGLSSPFSLMTEEEFAKYVSKTQSLGKASFFRGLAEEATEVVEEAEDCRLRRSGRLVGAAVFVKEALASWRGVGVVVLVAWRVLLLACDVEGKCWNDIVLVLFVVPSLFLFSPRTPS